MERKNREAMEYFKLGMNRTYYSTAFKRYRKEIVREHFGIDERDLIASGRSGSLSPLRQDAQKEGKRR